MGMYTEVFISTPLIEDIPEEVLNILKDLFLGKETSSELPDHEFFKTSRWRLIGTMSSFYFVPYSTTDFRYNDISKAWYIVSRSDLKNYEGEISKFFDWIDPYCDKVEGEFLGYSRYEEDLEPVLYYKKPFKRI